LAERGEFTIVVSGAPETAAKALPPPSADQLADEIGHLTDISALSRREAIRALAKRHGLSNKAVFNLLEEAKK
jgi:hypothetical protein